MQSNYLTMQNTSPDLLQSMVFINIYLFMHLFINPEMIQNLQFSKTVYWITNRGARTLGKKYKLPQNSLTISNPLALMNNRILFPALRSKVLHLGHQEHTEIMIIKSLMCNISSKRWVFMMARRSCFQGYPSTLQIIDHLQSVFNS